MSFGGGQSPAGDFLMRENVLPWNWAHAQQLAAQPFTPYRGTLSARTPGAINQGVNAAGMVAGYQPQQVQANQANASMMNTPYANASYGSATAMNPAQMGGVANVQAMTGMNGISAYMNPYMDSVVNATQADIERQRQMAINQGSSNAAMSNAWGGDRHGVSDSLTNEAAIRASADASANLRMGGYNQAAGLMQSDYNRTLNADLANQNMGFNVASTNAGFGQQANLANQNAYNTFGMANMGAANQFGLANQNAAMQSGLANQNAANQFALANQNAGMQAQLANQTAGLQGATTNLAGAQTLGQLGMNQYNIEQSGLDRAYQEFLRQMNQPYMNQTMLNQALGSFGTMQGMWTPPNNLGANMASGMTQGGSQGAGYYLMGL